MSKRRRTAPESAAARLCEWRGLNGYRSSAEKLPLANLLRIACSDIPNTWASFLSCFPRI